MNQNDNNNFIATAFVSCSLREEDRGFVNYIEDILIQHKIKPIGTVGYHSASPTNTAESMKKNIPLADFIVIVATPRYVQKDIGTGKMSYGLSEMVHVEAGMAYMADKPVVVFVQEGTSVGNFLPNITQYITLNGQHEDLEKKWSLINSLIEGTYNIILKFKEQTASKSLQDFIKTGLMIYGGVKLVQSITKKK